MEFREFPDQLYKFDTIVEWTNKQFFHSYSKATWWFPRKFQNSGVEKNRTMETNINEIFMAKTEASNIFAKCVIILSLYLAYL